MRTTNVSIRNRGLIALFCAAALMLVTASPSLAAKTIKGAGVGAGTEEGADIGDNESCIPDPLPPIPIMGTIPNDQFDITLNGTWSAVDTAGVTVALYAGVSTLQIKIGPHVISPEGTYLICGVPLPVPVQSWTVHSPNQPQNSVFDPSRAGVQCSSTATAMAGQYERRASSVVAFALLGRCSIKGGVAPFLGKAENVDTAVTVAGEMHPCDLTPMAPDPTPNPACVVDINAGANLFVTWQAAGASP